MKALIILGHPKKGSFNHAIADVCIKTVAELHYDVTFHDLYDEGFDPILGSEEIPINGIVNHKIQSYVNELKESQLIIVIHPNWWGQPPAILKGWIDRVFRPGSAYKFREGDSGEGVPIGLLKGKAAMVFNTSNTMKEREIYEFGDPLQQLWEDCIFKLCGIEKFQRKMYETIVTSSLEQRNNWLDDIKNTIINFCIGK